jgi:hypothetical protein
MTVPHTGMMSVQGPNAPASSVFATLPRRVLPDMVRQAARLLHPSLPMQNRNCTWYVTPKGIIPEATRSVHPVPDRMKDPAAQIRCIALALKGNFSVRIYCPWTGNFAWVVYTMSSSPVYDVRGH